MMIVRRNAHVGGRYRFNAGLSLLLFVLLSTTTNARAATGAITPKRNIQEFQNTTNTTTSPTVPTPTMSPTNSSSDNTTTPSPTLVPTPHNSSNTTTPSPSISPNPTISPSSNATTLQPTTLQPTTLEPTTLEPTTLSPTTLEPTTPEPTIHTTPPTSEPTLSPTPKKNKKKHLSIGRIIAKTIAYILIMILCVLLFGAIMSNRYRIYYALRGLWHVILQLNCTRWIRQKIRYGFRRSPSSGGSLNDTIFEPSNDMTQGLLLNDA
mmetsp:Transcript_5324/g.6474  ORF Transcript_5324/g.6474 Transcript_5324/m.6474 type:complete len:265 (+) Transcript_5324:218-1012(+)